jgi:hypothetical protein
MKRFWALSTHTLRTVDNLAIVYSLQLCSEAEALYGRTLEANEKVFGPDHPDMTKSSIKYHIMRGLRGTIPEILDKEQGGIEHICRQKPMEEHVKIRISEQCRSAGHPCG